MKALSLAMALAAAGASASQLGDAPYHGSSPAVVQAMLELAELRSGDVVYDLGCGDGRIVIAAVRTPGVRGVCVELHADRLRWAREAAEQAGVVDQIRFVEGDLYRVPIADASVVAIYLLRAANLRLRPRLLKELRPGARVVSSTFDMGDWEPQRKVVVGESPSTTVYRWVIPPR